MGVSNASSLDQNGNEAQVSPTQRLRVQQDGTQIFYEDWASGAIDTVFNWNAAVTNGAGASSTPSLGQEVLTSGTAANAYAYLTSKQKFQPTAPGFIEFDHQLQFTFPVPAHTYCFWGCGNPAASPTALSYAVDAVGFEISATGKMSAVTWAGSGGVGTRTLIKDLSSSGNNTQPLDGSVHRYQIYLRGDTIYWLIDNITVAFILTGALGPNVNTLPFCLQTGCDTVGTSSQMSLTSAAGYVADSTKALQSSQSNTSTGCGTFAAVGGSGTALLTNSAVAVKTTGGNLYSVDFYNPNGSVAYVQLFDVAAGSVTLATTVPKLSFPLLATSKMTISFADEAKISFLNAITIAATTTATGNSAPATGITANIGYR